MNYLTPLYYRAKDAHVKRLLVPLASKDLKQYIEFGCLECIDSLQKIRYQQSITKNIYFATCKKAFSKYAQLSQMQHPPEEIENNPFTTK